MNSSTVRDCCTALPISTQLHKTASIASCAGHRHRFRARGTIEFISLIARDRRRAGRHSRGSVGVVRYAIEIICGSFSGGVQRFIALNHTAI